MKINLCVLGAGSFLGRHLCRRAVRMGWDVHAFSIYNMQEVYKQAYTLRQRTLYNRGVGDGEIEWMQHLSWVTDLNYDANFEHLRDEIRNVTGLVYFYEDTPFLKQEGNSFEQNVIELSRLAGTWSVRHFATVQSEQYAPHSILSNKAQQQIGQTNPFMIVSLLRPGKVYDYTQFSTCIPVYKNRTLRSIGIDTQPVNMISADAVVKCITTLIHNTNDPNIYRILEGHDIEQYLAEEKVPFDSPDYDYSDALNEEDESNEEDNDNDDDEDEDDSDNKQHGTHKYMRLGFEHPNMEIDSNTQTTDEDIRDDQEKRDRKVV
mmetsp:Transcript_32641/g.52940  ORF Transcript_32641/g.52940 Transcript_32641/m.52940 type:complete len:319 (+) Transcript_32641:18-974(+)